MTTPTMKSSPSRGPAAGPRTYGIRKIGAQPSLHLQMEEQVKPIEEHEFTLADFTRDKVTLRMFKWDLNTQPPEALDTLEPFYTVELPRPS